MEITNETSVISRFSTCVSFLNGLPRFPYLFCADCVYCTFLIRKSLSINSRLVSLVFTIFITTLNDNIEAYIKGFPLPVFANYFLPTCVIVFWVLFNMFPNDLVFKTANFISPVIAFATGIINGRNVCRGIDIFSETGEGIIYVMTSAILFAFSKYMFIFLYARLSKRTIRSVFVVLFELVLGGLIYILFTDISPIYRKAIWSLDEMSFIVQILTAFIEVLRDFVSDEVFGKLWHLITSGISCVIPYYGKTWIPDQTSKEDFYSFFF